MCKVGVLVVKIQASCFWFHMHLVQVKWAPTVSLDPVDRTSHQNAHTCNLSCLASQSMVWPSVEIESSFTFSSQASCRVGWVKGRLSGLQLRRVKGFLFSWHPSASLPKFKASFPSQHCSSYHPTDWVSPLLHCESTAVLNVRILIVPSLSGRVFKKTRCF